VVWAGAVPRIELAAQHEPASAEDRATVVRQGAQVQPQAASASQEASQRPGTKKLAVLALLRRPEGATLSELMQATGWQAHSVRGFLSGTVAKKMGHKVARRKRDDGASVYFLTE
jgi:CTP:molybdopterin cytidylyltransferase MocA